MIKTMHAVAMGYRVVLIVGVTIGVVNAELSGFISQKDGYKFSREPRANTD